MYSTNWQVQKTIPNCYRSNKEIKRIKKNMKYRKENQEMLPSLEDMRYVALIEKINILEAKLDYLVAEKIGYYEPECVDNECKSN